MAYYLFNTTNTASVAIASTSIGATNGDYIEFSGFASSGNAGGVYRIIGISGSFNTLIEVQSSSILFRPGNNQTVTFNTNYTQPAVGQDFVIKIVKITGGYECFLNAVSIGTAVASSQMTFDQFFAFSTGRSESFLGGCYYIKASNNGGVSDTNFWDPSASNGTGTTLKDTVGNNDGTLNLFSGTTNSWWVFYSTGISVTVSIVEAGPSFTDSIASIVTDNITASIASNGPSFTDSITVLSIGNITTSIVGTGPSFTDSISITSSAPSLITTSIIESGPSFSDAILLAVPTVWTDKVKVVTNWTDR
jgi:hypothetical protein